MHKVVSTAKAAVASQIVCHECDLLNDVPALGTGQKAFCPRCGFLLAANRPNAQTVVFAFSATAIVFLLLASLFPFLGFSARGQEHTVTLMQSIWTLVAQDYPVLAVVVFVLIIAVPATLLLGLMYVSFAITIGKRLPGIHTTLRWMLELLPWSMAEIFLIGVLVSFIKIVSLADVTLGLSFWSYVLFTINIVVVVQHIDRREMWRHIRGLTGA